MRGHLLRCLTATFVLIAYFCQSFKRKQFFSLIFINFVTRHLKKITVTLQRAYEKRFVAFTLNKVIKGKGLNKGL